MNEEADSRAELTRQKILDSASRHFARRSFTSVSIDDVIASTDVSKGALYSHFQSRHSLALAIVEHHAANVRANTMELLTRGGSGLEMMFEITFVVAVLDAGDDYARAAANLTGEVSRPGDRVAGPVDEWIKGSTLPGFTNPDRFDYLKQFVHRRATAAIRSISDC